jgi:DDE superfamily endonuclease
VEERLLAAIPCTTTLPIQVFAHDESRIGLQTIRRRRITARGVKPHGTLQHDYANCWVYGSIAPSSGEHFFLLLPTLDAEQMQIFVDEFAKAHASTFNVLLLDNSGAHTASTGGGPPRRTG